MTCVHTNLTEARAKTVDDKDPFSILVQIAALLGVILVVLIAILMNEQPAILLRVKNVQKW